MPLTSRRGLLGAALAVSSGVAAAPAHRYPAVTSAPAPDQTLHPVRVMSGELGGTFVKIGSDLQAAIDAPGVSVMCELSKGSLHNLTGILRISGVDLGFVASDTLAYAKQFNPLPGINRVQYISKLYNNELHIAAKDPSIRSFVDLRGKRVAIDVEGSGTSVTCMLLSQMLGVGIEAVHASPERGKTMLEQGEVAALAYAFGKPGSLFRSFDASQGVHLVEIPYAEPLQQDYLPVRFTAQDYPNLLSGSESVASVGMGVVLACFGWDPGTDRYRQMERFVQVFFQKFPELRDQSPPYHPKWRDVDLQAQAPGWVRFAPAEQLLATADTSRASGGQDPFQSFLESLGEPHPGPKDRERLLRAFRALRR